MYVYQAITLFNSNLCTDVVNYFSLKLGGKVNKMASVVTGLPFHLGETKQTVRYKQDLESVVHFKNDHNTDGDTALDWVGKSGISSLKMCHLKAVTKQ